MMNNLNYIGSLCFETAGMYIFLLFQTVVVCIFRFAYSKF